MFGCGESVGPGSLVFRDDVAETLYARRADRLRHMQRINQDVLEAVLDRRGRFRRALLAASRMFGLLAAVGPAFAAFGEPRGSGAGGRPPASAASAQTGSGHTVPSTSSTVRLGVFDATLPNVLDVDSGDVIVYPDTWTHFLNRR